MGMEKLSVQDKNCMEKIAMIGQRFPRTNDHQGLGMILHGLDGLEF
jgi:hypothetical protein